MRKTAFEFVQQQPIYILVEFSISFVNHYFIDFTKSCAHMFDNIINALHSCN